MSHSKFYSSLVLLIALNAIVKPLWIFGIDRQVQNVTGVSEYGIYFSLLNLSIVFGFLLDWGLNNFLNRELAARKIELQEQLGSFLIIRLLFFLSYAVSVLAVAWISGVTRYVVLAGVIVIQFLTFLFLFFRTVITANQWFRTDAWLSVLDKSMMILVCGCFIFLPIIFGGMTIEKFIVCQIVCTALATAVVIIILLSRGIAFKRPSLRFFNRPVILSVLPFAFVLFLMSIHTRLDGFLLERLHRDGAHETGIYATAYRLLDASNMVGYLMASFFMPFVARIWSEGKPLQDLILQTRHLQLMFAITITVVTIMLAPWLQQILYHRDDPYGIKVLRWCLPALTGYGLTQVYGTVMTATGHIVSFCYLNLLAVIINIGLNILLIPHYGAWGCCVAALISQVLLGCGCMTYVHGKLGTSYQFSSLILYGLAGITGCGILYGLQQAKMNSFLLMPVAALVSFLFMWIGKMIPVKGWLYFLKKQ